MNGGKIIEHYINKYSVLHTKEIQIIRCATNTAQKMKYSVKDFFCKCDQIFAGNCRFVHVY